MGKNNTQCGIILYLSLKKDVKTTQYIIRMHLLIKPVIIIMKIGFIAGGIYGFGRSMENTKWASLSTQVANAIVNVIIMGVGGAIIGLMTPISMGAFIYRLTKQ
jgi:hypothetical protein